MALSIYQNVYANFLPPTIELIDIKDKQHRKRMNGHFSDILIEEMTNTLSQGNKCFCSKTEEVMRLLYSVCIAAQSPQCPHCDVSLTFHHSSNQLRCHYCGYAIPMPKTCIACGSVDLKTKGFGTEQISKELEILFPQIGHRPNGSRYYQWQIRI